MSQEVTERKEHLAALDAFIESRAYTGYLAARKIELKDNEDAQVAITPDTLANIVELLQLKGEHRYLELTITMFEDARTSLSNRIDEMLEQELQTQGDIKR